MQGEGMSGVTLVHMQGWILSSLNILSLLTVDFLCIDFVFKNIVFEYYLP